MATIPIINLNLDAPDGIWSELDPAKVVHVTDPIHIITLPHGMQSGKPSAMIRIDLPDGRSVVAETSVANLLVIFAALRGRYGDDI